MAYRNISSSFFTNGGVNYDLQWDNTNGKVQLIQHNAPAGTSPIFYDGSWSASRAAALGINAADQQRIYNNIQSSVRSAFNTAGGTAKGNTIPQWATAQNQGNAPGQQTNAPATAPNGFNPGGFISALTNPGEAIAKVGATAKDPNGNFLYGANNEKEIFGGDIMYPIDLDTARQDTFVVTMFRYSPPNAAQLLTGNLQSIVQSGLYRGTDRLEEVLGTVHLPMPTSISEMKSTGWGGERMNNLSAAALSSLSKNAAGAEVLAGLSAASGFAANIFAATKGINLGLDPGNIAKSTVGGGVGLNVAQAASGSAEGRALLGSTVLSAITKLANFNIPVETILSRGAGVVPNENLELLFGGPSLRVFSVSYRMTARSPREAVMIRKIIRFFKQGMSPKKRAGAAGGPSLFLSTPNVFSIRFMNGGSDIQGVSRFKTCALTSMTTDYTPDGFWVAYEQGQPVSTRITLAFAELEPIYDTDYQESVLADRSDLISRTTKTGTNIGVSNTEVGY